MWSEQPTDGQVMEQICCDTNLPLLSKTSESRYFKTEEETSNLKDKSNTYVN